MKDYEIYKKRFAFQEVKIAATLNPLLNIVVVIPAYKELSLIKSVESILKAAIKGVVFEIIVVFNSSIEDKEAREINQIAFNELVKYIDFNQLNDKVFCMKEILPIKHAGVGLARKIGMDEAAFRFSCIDNLDGVIVCFDADSLCQENYLEEIQDFFQKNKKTAACSIHFEHPLSGNEHQKEIYEGICYYELHLRYYKQGLAYANLPFAYHSIGSSMAVRAAAYMKQGGMNRRKAGEDFYFLQKFIDIESFGEISKTTVIPSPRMSDRVPFGTGRAIKEMLDDEREIEKSYAFEIFETLKDSFANVKDWYFNTETLNLKLIQFIGEGAFIEKVQEIKNNSTTAEGFEKRFFQWFNAFKTLKYVHFLRDEFYPNKALKEVVPQLLYSMGSAEAEREPNELLLRLRELDKTN